MSLLSRDVYIPVFLHIAEGALGQLNAVLRSHNLFFRAPLVVGGDAPIRPAARAVAQALAASGAKGAVHYVRDSSFAEVERLMRVIDRTGPDLVVGVGGGKALDVAKLAAAERLLGFVSVPTAISHDGICSPVAVIGFDGETRSLRTNMPLGICVDLTLIRRSPRALKLSGVGDLISNLSATEDYRLASRHHRARLDSFADIMAHNAARSLVNLPVHDLDDALFLKTLVEGLVMSGIAMGIVGSSLPASGAEHMISHALDQLYGRGHPHGLQVGLCTPLCLALRDQDPETVRRLLRSLGMPMTPQDLGFTPAQFLAAVKAAPATRPGRYTLFNELAPRPLQMRVKAYFSWK